MLKQIVILSLAAIGLSHAASAQDASEGIEVSPIDDPTPAEPVTSSPPPSPSALQGFHAGGAIGPVFYRDNNVGDIDLDYDTGGQIAAFAGKSFGMLRVEVEVASQGAEFDPDNSQFDGDLSIFRMTANLYLDIATFDVGEVKDVTPYVGGGLGVAIADIEGFDDDDTGFTTHGEVGFSFPIHKHIDIIPAYRYEWTDFNELDDNQKAHTIRAGARYRF